MELVIIGNVSPHFVDPPEFLLLGNFVALIKNVLLECSIPLVERFEKLGMVFYYLVWSLDELISHLHLPSKVRPNEFYGD